MPELPDLTIYLEALDRTVRGQTLRATRVPSLFVLRTFDPPIDAVVGRRVLDLRRIGKRVCLGFEDDLWVVIHLMIAGRLHWKRPAAVTSRSGLAAFDFDHGTLLLTETGPKKRASIHVVRGTQRLLMLDPGGIDVLACDLETFSEALTRRNHTLKRALADPHLFSGIGNAHSDEILHRARLSPVALTQRLAPDAVARLHAAVQTVLGEWIERLRAQAGGRFPERVTPFRPEMAVHGRYGQPCPVCGTRVQRIRYADNETNYCPRCQTSGKVLADRSLSRLLKDDWPRSIAAWEDT